MPATIAKEAPERFGALVHRSGYWIPPIGNFKDDAALFERLDLA